MKKAIVTTTINPPTKALEAFIKIAQKDDWYLFIVGDQKTPHAEYQNLHIKNERVIYIGPDQQVERSVELSELIGWNCIQRRNFGFLEAYLWGAEIIATIDDDNIPMENWGKDLTVGKIITLDVYETEQYLFDPLSATPQGPNIWHRGFPVQLLRDRNKIKGPHPERRKVLVQADLWNGDPDIDAICRIAKNPIVKFDAVKDFYSGSKPGPFNSQNTFLHRSVLPLFFMFPHIGRMDDIWASYMVQREFPKSVVYGPPSVVQERNEHDLVKDLEAEMIGYKHTLDFTEWLNTLHVLTPQADLWPEYMPADSIAAFDLYRSLLNVSDS